MTLFTTLSTRYSGHIRVRPRWPRSTVAIAVPILAQLERAQTILPFGIQLVLIAGAENTKAGSGTFGSGLFSRRKNVSRSDAPPALAIIEVEPTSEGRRKLLRRIQKGAFPLSHEETANIVLSALAIAGITVVQETNHLLRLRCELKNTTPVRGEGHEAK